VPKISPNARRPAPKRLVVTTKKKTSRGALIKGMSRRLPSEILESPVFKEGLEKLLRKDAGIYALYREDKLYYVGLTRNLFGRITWHQRDRHKGRWDSFVVFRIKRVGFLKDIETLITRIIEVPGNRQRGNVPRDADINRLLQRILRDHRRDIRAIEKAIH
jgi:hypothetical protein